MVSNGDYTCDTFWQAAAKGDAAAHEVPREYILQKHTIKYIQCFVTMTFVIVFIVLGIALFKQSVLSNNLWS